MSSSAGPVPHIAPGPLAAAPAPRSAGMMPMPAVANDGIGDDDLYTQEEMAQRLAGLLGMDPTQLGAAEPVYDHNENIAEKLEQNWLDNQGSDILDMIEADLESRAPWEQRFKRGLELIGLKDFVWEAGKAPFEGASTAVHPMLAEAIVQSQARLMEEVFPSSGPVKTTVMGQESEDKRDSADRVQDHMNYQLTMEDETYLMESEKLALYLPIFGTAYRKAYHDYVTDQNVLRYVTGEDMILPYSARNLKTAKRKTHRFKVEEGEFDRAKAAGAYCDVDLQEPPEATPTGAKAETDKVDSIEKVDGDTDLEWTFYETDLYLDIPGYEDKGEDGQASGIALPYTVTLESEQGKILAIRRCWKENDPLKLIRTRYSEYWYLPGLGAYGFGLIHMIGTLAEAGTDAVRALLDSATWANLQGGFKAKDAGVKAGELRMSPGAWLDVDMTADELSKAFHTPPVREPSEALFKLLGFLTEQAQRFSSTTDMMVGNEESKGAPVGTTIALIEQGSKVYSGVHKRAHFAAGVEFRMLFDLNAEYIPAEGYPYLVPGDDKAVYQQDYDTKTVSVEPVSDPNIYSQTQRIALAQSRYQLAKDNPAHFNMHEVLEGLLKAFKDPSIDTTLVDPDHSPVMDPISENIAMVTGRPVKAKDGENHDTHLINHLAFAQHPQFGGSDQAQKMFGPQMIAHIAEHVALKYADTQRKLGVPVPPINLSAPSGTSIIGDEQPDQSDSIAMAGAMKVAEFMQQSGFTTTPPGQDNPEVEDKHHESLAKQFNMITMGLSQMVKVGQTLQDSMAAEQAVESGQAPPDEDQGGGAFASGPAPGKPAMAPAKKPAAPKPAPDAGPAVSVNVHQHAPALEPATP